MDSIPVHVVSRIASIVKVDNRIVRIIWIPARGASDDAMGGLEIWRDDNPTSASNSVGVVVTIAEVQS